MTPSARLTLTALLTVAAIQARAAPGDESFGPPERFEARSSNLLAVGILHDDRLNIHVSRLLDNAPLRDAVVAVLLRGTVHPTTAEADGSYSMQSKELRLPGTTAIVLRISQANTREDLQGTLRVGAIDPTLEDKNSARQWSWWILNFAVCIGFLMLLSRRRKAAAARESE